MRFMPTFCFSSELQRRLLYRVVHFVRVEIYVPAFCKLLAFYGELCRFLPVRPATEINARKPDGNVCENVRTLQGRRDRLFELNSSA